MIRASLAVLALMAVFPAEAQQPTAPPAPDPPMVANPPIRWLSPEQKAEIEKQKAEMDKAFAAAAERQKAEEARRNAEAPEQERRRQQQELQSTILLRDASRPRFVTREEKETACVAKAREKAVLPVLDKLTVLSGDTNKNREFVRLSWDPRDAPKVEYAAFECFFERDELVSSKPDIDLIAK